MKKLLIVLLIFAYMNCYFGCATKYVFTDKELDTGTNNDNLIVVTKDSIHYYFDANMYRFENDSLDGIAKINDEEKKQRVKIALEDIVRTGEVINVVNAGPILGFVGYTVLGSLILIGVLWLVFIAVYTPQ